MLLIFIKAEVMNAICQTFSCTNRRSARKSLRFGISSYISRFNVEFDVERKNERFLHILLLYLRNSENIAETPKDLNKIYRYERLTERRSQN